MDLDIPEFLKRAKPARRGAARAVKAKWAPVPAAHTPPDGYEAVRLRLGDEIPHAGCGVRVVHIKAGYKWVYAWSSSTGNRRRLKRSAWDLLRKRSEMSA